MSLLLPITAFAVTAGLCALLFHTADAFEYSFLKVARHDIRRRTETVTSELASHLKAGDFEAVRRYAAEMKKEGVRITVMDAAGKTLVDTGKPRRSASVRHREFIDTLANGESLTISRTDSFGEYMLYSSRNVGGRVVRLAIPYRQADEPAKLAALSLATAAAAGVFLAIAVFLTTRRLHRRIDLLAAEREEQKRLAEETARMENFRRVFVENVTHEIKTPLASLSGAVEMLGEDVKIPEAERASLLRIAARESKRLELLINDILSLAGIESSEGHRDAFEDCDLAGIVRDAVEAARPAADRALVRINAEIRSAVTVSGDALKLETAVSNLLSNAVRYGGSPVSVSLVREGKNAVLRVADRGPGIAAEHIPHVFERFYRVDPARSRNSGGTGLGLAIVKHVAILHGGSVSCSSEPGKGSVFTLEVPCA